MDTPDQDGLGLRRVDAGDLAPGAVLVDQAVVPAHALLTVLFHGDLDPEQVLRHLLDEGVIGEAPVVRGSHGPSMLAGNDPGVDHAPRRVFLLFDGAPQSRAQERVLGARQGDEPGTDLQARSRGLGGEAIAAVVRTRVGIIGVTDALRFADQHAETGGDHALAVARQGGRLVEAGAFAATNDTSLQGSRKEAAQKDEAASEQNHSCTPREDHSFSPGSPRLKRRSFPPSPDFADVSSCPGRHRGSAGSPGWPPGDPPGAPTGAPSRL